MTEYEIPPELLRAIQGCKQYVLYRSWFNKMSQSRAVVEREN